MLDGGSKNLYCTRLVFSRFSVCTVINGKHSLHLWCIKGRKVENGKLFHPPSQVLLRASNSLSNYSFARINKWRCNAKVTAALGTRLIGVEQVWYSTVLFKKILKYHALNAMQRIESIPYEIHFKGTGISYMF